MIWLADGYHCEAFHPHTLFASRSTSASVVGEHTSSNTEVPIEIDATNGL